MKKINQYILILPLLMAGNNQAVAAENDLLAKALSLSYGAPVEVDINENKCQIVYPEVVVNEEVYEQNPENEGQLSPKTISSTIDATNLSCARIADFGGMTQYKVLNKSPNRLMAQIYNLTQIPMLKDLQFKNFNEEMQIVPEVGLTSLYKIHFDEASYTSEDADTGLKSEVGSLKNLDAEISVSPVNDSFRYLTDIKFDNFNMLMPFASMHMGSYHQVAEAIYQPTETQAFDYVNMLQNIPLLTTSRSRVIANDIRISSDMLGAKVVFDLESRSKADLDKNGLLNTDGSMEIKNIKYSGDILEPSKQPQAITFDIVFDGVKISNLSKLVDFQQKMQEMMEKQQGNEDETNPNLDLSDDEEQELIKSLDEMLDKAKLKENVVVKFANAEITAEFELSRKNMFLDGYGNISINNFFEIFPELKACQTNPQADECMTNPIFAGISQYIDLSKNPAKCNLKFTQEGVFFNGEKVAEPVEMNLQKMYNEHKTASDLPDFNQLGDESDLSADYDKDDSTDDESVDAYLNSISSDDMLDKISQELE